MRPRRRPRSASWPGGFFAGYINHALAALRHFGADLEQQRGFSDAGFAAQQRHAAAHPAAAEDAVKLVYAGWDSFLFFDFEAGDRYGGLDRFVHRPVRKGGLHLLFERPPRAALRAFAHEGLALVAAFGTFIKTYLFFSHF